MPPFRPICFSNRRGSLDPKLSEFLYLFVTVLISATFKAIGLVIHQVELLEVCEISRFWVRNIEVF